jgi:hypothetical protein
MLSPLILHLPPVRIKSTQKRTFATHPSRNPPSTHPATHNQLGFGLTVPVERVFLGFMQLFHVIDIGSTGSRGRTWGLPVYIRHRNSDAFYMPIYPSHYWVPQ